LCLFLGEYVLNSLLAIVTCVQQKHPTAACGHSRTNSSQRMLWQKKGQDRERKMRVNRQLTLNIIVNIRLTLNIIKAICTHARRKKNEYSRLLARTPADGGGYISLMTAGV